MVSKYLQLPVNKSVTGNHTMIKLIWETCVQVFQGGSSRVVVIPDHPMPHRQPSSLLLHFPPTSTSDEPVWLDQGGRMILTEIRDAAAVPTRHMP